MLMMLLEMYASTHPNTDEHVGSPWRSWGERSQDHGIGIDLQNAREKTATGSLTNTHDVQYMNEGRHDGMPMMFCIARELTPMSIMLAEFP
jgi:hypothetical protein